MHITNSTAQDEDSQGGDGRGQDEGEDQQDEELVQDMVRLAHLVSAAPAFTPR